MNAAQHQKELDDAAELEEKLEQLAEQCFEVFCDEYQAGNQTAIETASELVGEDQQYCQELEAVLYAMYTGNSQQHRVYEGVIERAVRRLIGSFTKMDDFDNFIKQLR